MVGMAASGKSTLARMLSSRLGLPLVDKDTVALPIMQHLASSGRFDPGDMDSPGAQELSPMFYEVSVALAAEQVNLGMSVVLTAPFNGRSVPGWSDSLAEAFGAGPVVLWIRTDPAAARGRIAARGLARDRFTLDNWDRFVSRTQFGPPHGPHLVLDAYTPSEDMFDLSLAYLVSHKVLL